jgi:SM-20-related protein
MCLNEEKITEDSIRAYKGSVLSSCPRHVVIDDLFDEVKLGEIVALLQEEQAWQMQKHTYEALYVDDEQWDASRADERFVKRDIWRRGEFNSNLAQDFLSFLRSAEFMRVLSKIFDVHLTDITVEDPEINSNYFRLGAGDFVEQHADESPGREVCMLLYLNKDWSEEVGGELSFLGEGNDAIRIAPLFNRCVLFDPSSKGSEHWVEKLNTKDSHSFRYNITSWYWSE